MTYIKNKQKTYLRIKKILDMLIGIMMTFLLIPVFFLIGLCIVIEDGFPVFFKQKRVGIHQTTFDIYKFRTMKNNTPKDCPTHLLEHPKQYITIVGRFLRQYSLDELPQFLNIAKGEMALVGPRPALWNQYDLIQERAHYDANGILPGLTGWAQIHGRDTLTIKDKAAYDGYYRKHLSFWLDLRCLIGTVQAVLKKDGYREGTTKLATDSKHKFDKWIICTNHSYMFYQFHRELIAELSKHHQVILSVPFTGHEKELEEAGAECRKIRIDRRGCKPFSDFTLMITYFRLLKKEKPDYVITYSIKPNIYAGIVCQLLKIPYCANVQGLGTAFQIQPLDQWVTFLYRLALHHAGIVFFENKANAAFFRRKKIIPSDRIKILNGAGVNLQEYMYLPYPQKRSVVRFLYLGRIMKEKGVRELFSAFERLHDAYGSQVILDIVGFCEDAYLQRIQELCQSGIAVFHGFQNNPINYYANADCVVLPSYHEGMSNVLLEAASVGRPVITSNIHGCREAVIDQISGYLCEPKNQHSLYQKMDTFMHLTQEERLLMGMAGRKHMETHFDRRKVVEETIQTLQTLKGY